MTSKRQRFSHFAEVINVSLGFDHQPATEKNAWFTSAIGADTWNVKDVRPDQKMLTSRQANDIASLADFADHRPWPRFPLSRA